METELAGIEWDVSWDQQGQQDVIFIDNDGPQQVYLTKSDLQTMLEALR